MGIPKFYGFLTKTPPFNQAIFNQLNVEVDILLLDLNGIIHANAQRVFGYGEGKAESIVLTVNGRLIVSQAEIYNRRFELFRGVFADIIKITRTVGPRRSLVIAVDGVPPEAKQMQQRGRRYVSAAERPIDQPFDSNCINPGTEFMRELDQYLRDQLKEVLNMDTGRTRITHPYAGVLPSHVLYSSHLVPGEGEHKIADHLRGVQANGQTAVVYGTDADLIMIYLLHLEAGWKNIYLYRDSVFRGQPQVNVIDLQYLARILRNLYPGVPAPLDDFVTLLFLNGNDFLPHFPVFERVWDALQTLIFGYRQFLDEHPGTGICSKDRIEWKNFGKFCEYPTEKWNDILLKAWADNSDALIRLPSLVVERCTTSVSQVTGLKAECVRKVDLSKFPEEWYKYVFSPKNGVGVVIPTEEDRDAMRFNYLEGLAWVYNYYKRGGQGVNWGWYYPWHYAPIFADLGKYIANHDINWELEPVFQQSDPVSPLEQMLTVMPPRSIGLIPEVLRGLYSELSPIFDLYPESFVTDTGGKQEEWQGVPILPFPNPLRIRWAFDMLRLPPEFTNLYAPVENLVLVRDINQLFTSGGQRGRGGNRRLNIPRGGYQGRGGSQGGFEARGGYQGRGGFGEGRGGYQGRNPRSNENRGAQRSPGEGRGGAQRSPGEGRGGAQRRNPRSNENRGGAQRSPEEGRGGAQRSPKNNQTPSESSNRPENTRGRNPFQRSSRGTPEENSKT